MMSKAELEGYRFQREDPHMSRSNVGPLVPDSRLIGLAIQPCHAHRHLHDKVLKIISKEELLAIDKEMENFHHRLGGLGTLVQWVKEN